MDKSWIESKRRFSIEYVRGCEEFLDYAFARNKGGEYIYCPCKVCLNRYYRNRCTVREHILVDGFSKDYKIWTSHGEPVDGAEYENDTADHVVVDQMNDMVNDGFVWPNGEDGFSRESPDVSYEKYVKLLKDAERELYPGCKNFTTLSFIVRLLQLKVIYGWSNTSLDKLMLLLKEAFPDGETLPVSYYEAKKFRESLGFKYIKYDACPNDCMLYWKDKKDAEKCDVCNEDRYEPRDSNSEKGNLKKKRTPRKQLRYFPIKERLQWLFMSSKTAKMMRWHAEELADDEFKMHPANSVAWQKFDLDHPTFANDRRNVRLGLEADGFNPYRTLNSTHSIWPVILINYNLPPEECTKQSSMMLSLLIDGKKAPGNDIDVYLQPLIEDLKDMWVEGMRTFDADIKKSFYLRAALMWMINDFPAYANLSGWSTKGALACPSCNEDTDSRWLKYSRKFSYAGHRRFLPTTHSMRRDSRNFVGKAEKRLQPPHLSGEDIFKQVEHVVNKFGKSNKPNNKRSHSSLVDDSDQLPLNWKKRSIFFELPYWKYNMLRHNLDVMHIEKNVCESLIATLLGTDKRTKDTLNSRRDLEHLSIRKLLHLVRKGENGKEVPPPASFTLTNEQKRRFLQVLKDAKFPDGYVSNISQCVNVKEMTIQGLKSHDYHVLMQQLPPIAIRKVLPKHVVKPLIELCTYFRLLCSKEMTTLDVDAMRERIVLTLCHLEKIFPPSFFNVMVHLTVHLADEVAIGGSVHFRWMYPIERFLRILKQYVRQRHHVEGSIAEGYLAEECLVFYSRYLVENNITEVNRPEQNKECGLGEARQHYLGNKEREQAHRYVLANLPCVAPFHVIHVDELRERFPQLSHIRIMKKHHDEFTGWFRSYVRNATGENEITDELRVLSTGPDMWAKSYKQGCTVNGLKFHTKSYGAGLKCQNSGVMLNADVQSYASTSDQRPVIGGQNYFGRLTHVIELCYSIDVKFIMFKCEWVENRYGYKKDEFGCTLVNFNHLMYKEDKISDEPFILASQARQVYYVDDDPIKKDWKVVVEMKPRGRHNMQGLDTSNVDLVEELSACPEAEPFAEQHLEFEVNDVEDGGNDAEDMNDDFMNLEEFEDDVEDTAQSDSNYDDDSVNDESDEDDL